MSNIIYKAKFRVHIPLNVSKNNFVVAKTYNMNAKLLSNGYTYVAIMRIILIKIKERTIGT